MGSVALPDLAGAYGVVTMPFSVRDGINIFLAGFVPTENLRFRDEALTFKACPPAHSFQAPAASDSYSGPAKNTKVLVAGPLGHWRLACTKHTICMLDTCSMHVAHRSLVTYDCTKYSRSYDPILIHIFKPCSYVMTKTMMSFKKGVACTEGSWVHLKYSLHVDRWQSRHLSWRQTPRSSAATPTH